MAKKRGPVTPNTKIIQDARQVIERLERELRGLEAQKADLTDTYNAQRASASPQKQKSLEQAYLSKLAKLNKEIRSRKNQIEEKESIVTKETRRINEDLSRGISVDPSGYRAPGGFSITSDTSPQEIRNRLIGFPGAGASMPFNQNMSDSFIDPATGIRWQSEKDYRDWAMRQMQNRYWDERQGRWVEGAPTGPGAMPTVIDGNRGTMPPIKSQPQPQMPGQPSFDPNIVKPFQDQAGIPWMESIGRTSPPISAYKNPSELAQKNENELRRGRTLTEQQIDLIKKALLERNRSL